MKIQKERAERRIKEEEERKKREEEERQKIWEEEQLRKDEQKALVEQGDVKCVRGKALFRVQIEMTCHAF